MRHVFILVVVALGANLLGRAQQTPDAREPNATGGASVQRYAESILTNGSLKARLYLPDSQKGYYRGTRFDWSGINFPGGLWRSHVFLRV